jgi:hypothetical protein
MSGLPLCLGLQGLVIWPLDGGARKAHGMTLAAHHCFNS